MGRLFSIMREPVVFDVLITSILLCGASVVLRYLSRGEQLGDYGTADVAERWAVHFGCLRIGVELAVIGIVAQLGIVERLFSEGRTALEAGDFVLVRNALILQLGLLALATLLSRVFSHPERSSVKGLVWPNACGFASVVVALILFTQLSGSHLW